MEGANSHKEPPPMRTESGFADEARAILAATPSGRVSFVHLSEKKEPVPPRGELVGESEYAVTSEAESPQMLTGNLISCVGLTVFDQERKRGMLMHLTDFTNVDLVRNIIERYFPEPGRRRVSVVPGFEQRKSKYGLLRQLIHTIKDSGFERLLLDVSGEQDSQKRGIRFDLTDGSVKELENGSPLRDIQPYTRVRSKHFL